MDTQHVELTLKTEDGKPIRLSTEQTEDLRARIEAMLREKGDGTKVTLAIM